MNNKTGKKFSYIWIIILLAMFSFLLIYRFKNDASQTPCVTATVNTTENAQVFLMGTIGGSYSDPGRDCWRENVVQPVLRDLGVTYYNPVVENWTEENAREEAESIRAAETIVLVITENHPSLGSLAESGWAVLSAVEREQTIILFIADEQENEDSQRARHIVLSQIETLAPQINALIQVESLEDVTIELRRLYAD